MAGAVLPLWIAVDWGTSHLRVWAMGADDTVLASRQSADGMGGLSTDAFETALLSMVDDWLAPDQRTPIIACGMVGARQGWVEAAYRAVPCSPAGQNAVTVPDTEPRIRVSILPGLMQANPADVMRGEETQIAGFLALHPEFSGCICLPGTHSKWVHVADGNVISFSTFMTGELFALLSRQSVLRHSIAEDGWSAEGFTRGLEQSFSAPQAAIGTLFGLRAETLLQGLKPDVARARLSGMMLGMELAATHTLWCSSTVAVIGASGLGRNYVEALEHLGGNAVFADGEAMTLAGLTAAYKMLQGQ